eukprot:scaffold216962_cov26-Tisochrysis_lutea.AAC.2
MATFEDGGEHLGRDSRAVVRNLHLDLDLALRSPQLANCHPDRALGRELDGIVRDVEQHLPEPRRIGVDPNIGEPWVKVSLDGQALLGGTRPIARNGLLERLEQSEGATLYGELAGAQARGVEQVID